MSGNGYRTHNEHPQSDEIRRDLEETRSEMQRTIHAIQEAVSPEAVARVAVDYFRRGPGEMGKNLGRVVRDNPVPFMLTGVGLAWLAVASTREPRTIERRRHYLAPPPAPGSEPSGTEALVLGADGEPQSGGSEAASRVRHAAQSVKSGASSAAGSVKSAAVGVKTGARRTAHNVKRVAHEVGTFGKSAAHAIGETAHNTAERFGNARERARERRADLQASIRERSRRARIQAQNVRDRAAERHERQPLILGFIGVAIGALLGALAPRTRREDRLLGSSSDSLKRRVRGEAEQAAARGIEKTTEIIEEVGDKTVDTVRTKRADLRERAEEGSARSDRGEAPRTGPTTGQSPIGAAGRPTSGPAGTGVSTPSSTARPTTSQTGSTTTPPKRSTSGTSETKRTSPTPGPRSGAGSTPPIPGTSPSKKGGDGEPGGPGFSRQ